MRDTGMASSTCADPDGPDRQSDRHRGLCLADPADQACDLERRTRGNRRAAERSRARRAGGGDGVVGGFERLGRYDGHAE
ncbi:hypothetical protein CC_2450 [Caulobacter vibrioides CB15]|uniref:Uncharacterized protein n=1 Tax=Caulobacter vibrioides (strain ATCC 19089 / CIP 103742 / CB 15) TaxID=190650 RepID=Q9A5J7_CAUVC|nr:hypothetical protein CC_2450 [Caulobacter vibrioides CB15]